MNQQENKTLGKESDGELVVKSKNYNNNSIFNNNDQRKRREITQLEQLKGVRKFISAGKYIFNNITMEGELIEINSNNVPSSQYMVSRNVLNEKKNNQNLKILTKKVVQKDNNSNFKMKCIILI
ncbi:Hypothetical protein SRAE_2000407200 [Strongyloides ratti]|uniref:Uncharacterized protein n=1 Tax=Strongyloides ratti TaxID=34506 RepID=A0A090LMM9_STRRB|nr:Hypothetical protein SRAE_2000407200 [Strongyloides ratti]CEF69423.1 Hypothetical protein SRAE_2000407200 [Strongyloides ratti]